MALAEALAAVGLALHQVKLLLAKCVGNLGHDASQFVVAVVDEEEGDGIEDMSPGAQIGDKFDATDGCVESLGAKVTDHVFL